MEYTRDCTQLLLHMQNSSDFPNSQISQFLTIDMRPLA